jgi:hypothetical protein
MSLWEERAGRNEALFREVNEGVEKFAREDDAAAAFVCECSNDSCTEHLRLELRVYEEVRSHARRFFVLPGHENPADHVIERHDSYLIVEKEGDAGRIAERTDPRDD